VKSLLDIPRTLEVLETQGVAVCAFGQDAFPAFYTRDSGVRAPHRVDSADEAAACIAASLRLGLQGGLLIAVPVPAAAAADAEELVQSGRVWGIDNQELGDRTFVPRDASYEVQVDDQLRRIWARMEVPSAPHLLAALAAGAGVLALGAMKK
jgi:hypothetical protein